MHQRPPPQSTSLLRSIISDKRRQGQLAQALALGRIGAELATRPDCAHGPDELSRLALARYLEQAPDDDAVRLALESLPRVKARRPNYRLRQALLLGAFAMGGAAYSWAYYFDRLPSANPAAPEVAAMPAPEVPRAPVASQSPLPVPVAEPVALQPDPRQALVVRAVGDVVLGSDYPVRRLPDEKDKARLLALSSHLLDADIVVGNLEGVLANGGRSFKDLSQPGRFTFRMPENYASLLRAMGFDVLNLANNHAFDFGPAGLDSTVRALEAEGIHAVGAAGAESLILEVKGNRIAFVSFSYLPHFAHLDDEERVRQEVARARAAADLVIVNVHAGREGQQAAGLPDGPEYFKGEYRGDLRKFGRLAVEAGASAVFGHGPHVVRPLEIYRGKPIFYSLGNFVGYRSFSTRGKLGSSIIAEVRFGADGSVQGIGVIPLKFDATGIPVADYSPTTIEGLGGLIDRELAKPPVLDLPVSMLEDSLRSGRG